MIEYSLQESEAAVELIPSIPPTASIIWLHGLGANGYDFVNIVEEITMPQTVPIHFIFPHAPHRPITINNGYVMRGWYDIKSFSAQDSEDDIGIQETQQVIDALINKEIEADIPSRHIFLGGFSQGGAIALHTGLRFAQRLGGILALSTYLPLAKTVPQNIHASNRDIPILMVHGTEDPVIPLQFALYSRHLLERLGYKIDWHAYPIGHSVSSEEIADIDRWLLAQFTERHSNR